MFIIEDWAADYAYAERIEATLSQSSPAATALRRKLDEVVADQPVGPTPLPQIGVELLQICGACKDVVRELKINNHWIAVERGAAELAPATFRLRDHSPDHWGWLPD